MSIGAIRDELRAAENHLRTWAANDISALRQHYKTLLERIAHHVDAIVPSSVPSPDDPCGPVPYLLHRLDGFGHLLHVISKSVLSVHHHQREGFEAMHKEVAALIATIKPLVDKAAIIDKVVDDQQKTIKDLTAKVDAGQALDVDDIQALADAASAVLAVTSGLGAAAQAIQPAVQATETAAAATPPAAPQQPADAPTPPAAPKPGEG